MIIFETTITQKNKDAFIIIPDELLGQEGLEIGNEVGLTITRINQSKVVTKAKKILKKYKQDFEGLANK